MELSPIYFLQDDLKALQDAIDVVRAQIRQVKAESAESVEQSSESWHDNYTFEDAQRQLRMLLNQLGGLSRALERAQLVEPPSDPQKGDVGVLVRFHDETTDALDEVLLGSSMVGPRLSALGCVSYQSPLGALLYGARVGDVRRGRVGAREMHVVILALEAGSFPADTR